MSLIKRIKDVLFWQSDEDFFDKEATIKEYFAVCPPERRRKVNSYDELYAEALRYVSKQSFAENTKDMEDYFYEMNQTDASVAILTGVFGYVIAMETDKNGGKLEKSIDKMLPKGFDTNNPFDTRVGGNHRYFGHDLLGIGLKNIPPDFLIKPAGFLLDDTSNKFVPISKVVGKNSNISMLDLIWVYYGKNSSTMLKGIFNCVGHTVVHFAKDLLTSEGIPLPFSSLFNEYRKIVVATGTGVSQKDYRVYNKFNDNVKVVNGNQKASDFTSLAFIEGMCKLYAHSKALGEKEKSFNRDMKIIAMGTCIMIQMSSLILGEQYRMDLHERGKGAMIPGAKLNVVMASIMFKNMVQEMAIVVQARNEVNAEYKNRLKSLEGGSK